VSVPAAAISRSPPELAVVALFVRVRLRLWPFGFRTRRAADSLTGRLPLLFMQA
jgi:hypothetical protein